MKIMSVTFRPVLAINLSTVQKILAQLFGTFFPPYSKVSALQGCTKGQKSGGAGSNAGRRRCPAAPSDLPKSGGAAAPPAPPLGASLKISQE